MWFLNMDQSEYVRSLSEDDRSNYIKKLTLSSGDLLPDPLSIADWSDDVQFLPDITNMDLVHYLIYTPSEFTQQSLRAYKSLEAYNFFIAGHVQDVFHHQVKDRDYCYIKSKVLPSQRQGKNQKLYDVWCALHKTGWILTGNCTCMAG